MATGSAGRWDSLRYAPGNPAFPTIADPGDPTVGIEDIFAVGAYLPRHSPAQHGPRRSGGGGVFRGFAGWYLDQIWTTPQPIDFASISSPKSVEVTVHNTRRTPIELQSVDVSPVPGISIADPALPVTIAPFSSQVVVVSTDLIGPNSFDELVDWVYDVAVVEIRILGRRVLLFNAHPEGGVKEQLVFATNVFRSKSGKEKAQSLRIAPRSVVRFDVRHVDDGVRALLHNIVLGGSPKIRVGRQSWWEARPLTAPATVGSVVVFYDTTFTSVRAKDTVSFALPSGDFLDREVLEKTDSSVTLTTPLPMDLPLGTYVVPVRFGYITRYPQMDVHPVNVEDMRVEFTTDDDTSVAALSPTEFDTHPIDGLPILKANFIGRGEKRAELSRRTRELDSGTGVMFSSGPESIGQAAVDVLVVLRSEQAVWEWRQFLHYVRGSWGRFYVPTFQNDVPLAEDLPLGGATLTARNTGLKRFLDARAPRRDVRVVTAAGEVYYRRILSVVDNGAVELVTLDQGIPGIGVSPKEKTRVSFMHLSRMDGDTATFTHYRQGRADLEFRTRTVKE